MSQFETKKFEYQMTKRPRDNEYDLEERTYRFARRVRAFVKRLPRTICNEEDVRQAVRSSGSVGANYIEANEAHSKKDSLSNKDLPQRI